MEAQFQPVKQTRVCNHKSVYRHFHTQPQTR